MASLSVILEAQTTGFTQAIKSAKDLLEQYTQKNKELSDTIKKNSDINDSQVSAYKRVIKQLAKVDSGTLSTTQSQKILTNQIAELKIQWNSLSETARNSDFGRAMSSSIKTAEKQLKQLRMQMKSVQDEMQNSDDKVKKLSQNMGGNLTSTLVSLAGKFAVLSTALKVVKDAFTSTESGADQWGAAMEQAGAAYRVFTNTLNSGNWSNFFRNLLNAIRGAKELYDALDKLGSIKSNNRAAIAIREQALAELRVRKQRGENVDEEIKKLVEELKEYRDLETNAGKSLGIKDMKQKIMEFSGPVSDALLNNVVKQILEKGDPYFTEDLPNEIEKLYKKAGTKIVTKTSAYGFGEGTDVFNNQETVPALENLTDAERDLLKIYEAAIKAEGRLSSGIETYAQAIENSRKTSEDEFKYGRWLKNNDTKKDEFKIDIPKIREDYLNALKDGNTEAARDLSIQLAVAIKNKGTFKSFEEFKEKLQEEINRMVKSQNQFVLETDIDIKPVEIQVNTDSAALAALKKEYEELKRQLEKDPLNVELQIKVQDIENDIKLIEQNPVQVETELYIPENSLKGLQNRLKELQAELEITVDPEAIKEILEDITNVQGKIDSIMMTSQDRFNTMIDGISDVNSASQNLYRTWLNLDETLSNIDTNFVDKMFAISDAILQTVESITTAVDAFQSMIQIIKQTQAAQNAATQQKISQNTAEAASNTATTTTSLSKAASDTFAAHAKIPFAGIAIAIGLIASMMAIMSSIKGFASGGIIEGKNTIGDYNLIRVNSGEAVLSTRQQARLWKILNGELQAGNSGNFNGNVEFHIEGSQLVGVLNNYTRRKSKI